MRPSPLFALSIFLAFLPLAQAKSPQEGGDLFVVAYVKAQQGENEEWAGHLDLALSKLQKAARMLDEVGTKFPLWSPAILNYRKARTAVAIARVKYEIAKFGSNPGGKSATGGPSAQKGAAVTKDLTDRERLLLELRKRIHELEQFEPREPAPKDWGLQFDPGIFVPLGNPRWQGW